MRPGLARPAALCLLVVLHLAACASPGVPKTEMRALYEEAVLDAMAAAPEEVRRNLVRLVPGEEGLAWRDGRVLLVAWSRERQLRRHAGEALTLSTEIPVTVAPVVEERCRGIHTGGRELSLRLEQLLGRPLGDGEGRRFVELWVRPEDVFRPCLDPDPRRSGCDLEAPAGVSSEHLAWLERRARQAHRPGGEPWTGLGYLYDWGDPHDETGPAEFIVRGGAEVVVERVAGTAEYCRRVRRR